MSKYRQDYYALAEVWNKSGLDKLLSDKYREEIEAEWNWKKIHEELDSRYPEYLMNEYEVEKFGEDPCYGIFVGTCFNMTPSGKYYTPFANSNVTIKEALKDEIYQEVLEDILEEQGLWSQSGEGDPCDVFFCKCLDRIEEEEETEED